MSGTLPVILEIPRFEGFNRKLQALAQKFVSGPISMIRVRSSFDFMNIEQAKELVLALKKRVYRSDRRLPYGRKEDGAGYCA